MGIKEDLPRVQYAVLRLGKGRARDLHLLRSRLDAGAAFEIAADRARRIEVLSPTPPSVAITAQKNSSRPAEKYFRSGARNCFSKNMPLEVTLGELPQNGEPCGPNEIAQS